MSEDKLYELRRDAWMPSGYWRAGIKHTQEEWRKEFNNPKLNMWNDWFIDTSIPVNDKNEPNGLYMLMKDVFEKKGLHSITYREAAMELAELWLKQNKKP